MRDFEYIFDIFQKSSSLKQGGKFLIPQNHQNFLLLPLTTIIIDLTEVVICQGLQSQIAKRLSNNPSALLQSNSRASWNTASAKNVLSVGVFAKQWSSGWKIREYNSSLSFRPVLVVPVANLYAAALSLLRLHIPIYHCFLLPLTRIWYSGLEEVVIMAHPRKSEEDKYKKMSISFEPEQLKQLISYCEREERTASWVIRKALSEWLEKHDSWSFSNATDTILCISDGIGSYLSAPLANMSSFYFLLRLLCMHLSSL